MGGDLHCHTRLSDGSLGIEDLILLAKKLKIETIAITDHDCLAGTVRGKVIGERHGVQVIPWEWKFPALTQSGSAERICSAISATARIA